MIKCFAAEFGQLFEVGLLVAHKEKEEGCGHGVSVGELLQASLLVEVWHQVPRPEAASTAVSSTGAVGTGVVGRRLGPSFHDVLLGVAHVPLYRLLSHTGTVTTVACSLFQF